MANPRLPADVRLTPTFVETIPEAIRPGVLYVSEKFRLATHLCAGGCGSESVTPLGDGGWAMTREAGTVTLSPSILHRPCGAHYFIEQNLVRWA